MDVIILAAGENVRLQAAGLPPGFKPLIIVENEVLVRRLARQAREVMEEGGELIIVCSPTNVREIVFATKDFSPQYVVQPEPIGPCEAVDRALPLCWGNYAMLLMGDNFIPNLDIGGWERPTVCTTASNDPRLHPVMNGRFTEDQSAEFRWLGPLVIQRDRWVCGEKDWIHALTMTPTFAMRNLKGVKDLGVLP